MEVVREITSISHDGFRNMWYPFHFEKDKRCNIINCEYIRESLDLIKLMQWMFATNNHNSNTEINYREASAKSQIIQCDVTFSTDKHRYQLSRIFTGKFSVEARLEVVDSTIVYFGQDAISTIQKMARPIIISANSRGIRSLILNPQDNFSKQSMLNLVNWWMKNLGINNVVVGLKSNGYWSYNETGTRRNDRHLPWLIVLLSNLAQATVRTRKFGFCPAILCLGDFEDVTDFERNSIFELVSTICKEERINFLLSTASIDEAQSENVTNTTRFSDYQ